MRLIILFYPWLELLSLIQLGIETSALVPLLWVIAMFMLGAALLKRVGTASVLRLREAQQIGVLQQSLFVDDLAVAVAALLLMIPGLLSDFFAIVVLIGPLRRYLAKLLMPGAARGAGAAQWQQPPSANSNASESRSAVVLEGDYQDISQNKPPGAQQNGFDGNAQMLPDEENERDPKDRIP
jgi:UPF0716 protein FxsA